MFFRKKLQRSDAEITIRELYRFKTHEYGEIIERDNHFPKKVNVEFIEICSFMKKNPLTIINFECIMISAKESKSDPPSM